MDPTLNARVVVEGLDDGKKYVTKRYPDGRCLSMLVLNESVLEKHMTYKLDWDLKELKKEKDRGVEEVRFEYWEKGGLEVGHSYYGSYLIGVMHIMDYTKITNPNIICDKVQTELDYEVSFPMVSAKKRTMVDGYSASQKINLVLSSIMHDAVIETLTDFEKEKGGKNADDDNEDKNADEGAEATECDFCGEMPCVWLRERLTVIAKDDMEHGHSCTVVNSTRRRIAFKHMFVIVNGGHGQKGVRKRLPECVEKGVRGLLTDIEFMGFKEA